MDAENLIRSGGQDECIEAATGSSGAPVPSHPWSYQMSNGGTALEHCKPGCRVVPGQHIGSRSRHSHVRAMASTLDRRAAAGMTPGRCTGAFSQETPSLPSPDTSVMLTALSGCIPAFRVLPQSKRLASVQKCVARVLFRRSSARRPGLLSRRERCAWESMERHPVGGLG